MKQAGAEPERALAHALRDQLAHLDQLASGRCTVYTAWMNDCSSPRFRNRTMRHRPLSSSATLVTGLVFALFASVSACDSRSSAFNAIAIDTLDSGNIEVRNPATGVWGSEPDWQLMEQVRIGALDGGGADVFGQIRGIAVSSNGNVHVLDYQANEVRVFSPDGAHVRTLGGRGGGPGELDQPFGLGIDDSDRIWTADSGNRRYTVWDSAGNLVGTRPRPLSAHPFVWTAGFDDDRLVEVSLLVEPSGQTRPALVRLPLDGSVPIDTFAVPPSPLPTMSYRLTDERGFNRMAATVPYAPIYHEIVADNGHYWLGASDRYLLHKLTFDGDTVRTVQREYSPVPVTATERDSAWNTEFLVRMREGGADLDPARIPTAKPAYHFVGLDDRGYLWVRRTAAAGQVGTQFDIFDPDGRYLGVVSTPLDIEGWPAPVIADGMIWAHVRDEFDMSYIVGVSIDGR